MSVTLICRGATIDLHESEKFNQVRHKLNKARKEYALVAHGGKIPEKYEPFHELSFRTKIMLEDEEGNEVEDENGGRIAVWVGDVIGFMDDERYDQEPTSKGPVATTEDDDEGDDSEAESEGSAEEDEIEAESDDDEDDDEEDEETEDDVLDPEQYEDDDISDEDDE